MCGVWGQIIRQRAGADAARRADAARQSAAAIAEAWPYLARRGPDGRGTLELASIGHTITLAHTRLAIIALSARGAQPMHDPASGWSIVFNGEIYNYRELHAELGELGEVDGHHATQLPGRRTPADAGAQAGNDAALALLAGDSDTDVLLRAWARWGAAALPRLNGMFAFAAVHARSGNVWLVRDRFGVKPLFWGRCAGGGIVFGSSAAGLATLTGADIDPDFCTRGARYKAYDTADAGSPYRNVHTVPAGTWVRFELQPARIAISERRWYSLQQGVASRQATLAALDARALAGQGLALFDDAVRLRLRSDVPVALTLSAGLDSAAIATSVAREHQAVQAFCFGAPDIAASEGTGAAVVAAAAGIAVNWVWPQPDARALSALLAHTLAAQEAPFCGLSPLAQHLVYRRVHEAGYKVLLGGQGSDEIFAGYRKFAVVALRAALHGRQPHAALRLLYSLGLMLAHEAGQAQLYWRNRDRYCGRQSAFRLLAWPAAPATLWGAPGTALQARQIADIVQWSLPTLLRYEDRNAMYYGVETRLPFMDYRLVEFALALPVHRKIADGYGKWLLRQMTAGRVPDAIRLNRRKRGFDVTADWIAQGLGASLRTTIFDARAALAHVLRPGEHSALLGDAALARDPDLLDEALLLAWLAQQQGQCQQVRQQTQEQMRGQVPEERAQQRQHSALQHGG